MQEMISGVFSPSWWALGSIYAEITLLVLDVGVSENKEGLGFRGLGV